MLLYRQQKAKQDSPAKAGRKDLIMAGYYNYSMSNNAVTAYANGEKPLSKWTKADIIAAVSESMQNGEAGNFNIKLLKKLPVKELKKRVLVHSSWHHTSKMFNRTDFYSLDDLSELTDDEIKEWLTEAPEEKVKEKTDAEAPECWECTFLVWSGTKRHPKAKEVTEVGEIRGNWFYREDGTKKSVTANGFKKIRKING